MQERDLPEHDRTGQLRQDNCVQTILTGQLRHDIRDRIAGTGQSWKVSGTGQPGQVSLDKTGNRGRPKHDRRERAARTDQPGQENLDRIRCSRTARTEQSGQDS